MGKNKEEQKVVIPLEQTIQKIEGRKADYKNPKGIWVYLPKL